MRLTSWVVLVLLGLGTATHAQQAERVRAIEHPEYSRLVLPVDDNTSWSLRRDGATAVLTLDGQTRRYDLTNVLDRIPRTRVLAVSSRSTEQAVQLTLALGCACRVEVTPLGSRLLALDVRRDRDARPVATAKGTLLNPAASAGADPGGVRRRPDINTEPTAQAEATADPDPRPEPDGASAESDIVMPSAEPVPETAANLTATERRVRVARDALIEQISRAAEQGLLSLAPDATDRLVPPQTPDTEAGEPALLPEPGDGKPAMQARLVPAQPDKSDADALFELETDTNQIRVRSPLENMPAEDAVVPDLCEHDADLAIGDWRIGAAPPAEALGELRRRIVAPDGQIDADAIDALVRFYIVHGFGHEAAMLIEKTTAPTDLHLLLGEVAQLIEGKVTADGAVARADGCDGRFRLWRAVGGFEQFLPETDGGADILASLAELPPPVRRLAASQIAEHALRRGDAAAANPVFELLDRTPGHGTAKETALRAAGSMMADETSISTAYLTRLLQLNPDTAPLFATIVLDAWADIPAPLVAAVANRLRAMRGRPEAVDLEIVLARLEARGQDPIVGLRRLATILQTYPARGQDIARAGRAILTESDLAVVAPRDVERILIGRQFLGDDAESRDLSKRLARNLIVAGLPNLAGDLVRRPDILPDTDTLLISAEAEISMGRGEAALALLEGMAAPAAARLRADALLRDGWVDGAYDALKTVDEAVQDRNRLAVLSRNWAEVSPDLLDPAYQGLLDALSGAVGPRRPVDATQSATGDKPALLEAGEDALAQAAILRTAVSRTEEAVAW